jgi:hypothetical protein
LKARPASRHAASSNDIRRQLKEQDMKNSKTRFAKTIAALGATLALAASGGAGIASASHGADDPAGHHRHHQNERHHHHGREHGPNHG